MLQRQIDDQRRRPRSLLRPKQNLWRKRLKPRARFVLSRGRDPEAPGGWPRLGRLARRRDLLGTFDFMILTDFLPVSQTFSGDFAPDRLDSRSLRTLQEWENRVLLEEHYVFNVAIPLEVE